MAPIPVLYTEIRMWLLSVLNDICIWPFAFEYLIALSIKIPTSCLGDRQRVLDWLAINKPDINPSNVHEFACGEAVLDYLRQGTIDILFLDCRMNGIDGIQTAKQIRKTNCKMVIIVLSNYKGYALYVYDAGIYRYLLKSEFDKKIDDIFEGGLSSKSELNISLNVTAFVPSSLL